MTCWSSANTYCRDEDGVQSIGGVVLLVVSGQKMSRQGCRVVLLRSLCAGHQQGANVTLRMLYDSIEKLYCRSQRTEDAMFAHIISVWLRAAPHYGERPNRCAGKFLWVSVARDSPRKHFAWNAKHVHIPVRSQTDRSMYGNLV